MGSRLRRGDWLLLAAVLAVSLAALALVSFGEAGRVDVYLDGERIESLPLDRDGSYPITTPYGQNTLVIEGGRARVQDADCPGGDCMRGEISAPGAVIACLPHHLVFRVQAEDGPDAVSY